LRAIGERERADAWESRVSEFGDIENLENVALETFLQILDPDIGSPRVVLGQSSVSVRCTDKNPGRTVEITVSNNGRGHLHGSAMLLGNKQGIVLQTTRIDANRFGERETAIRVQVDATEWERGKEYRSTVILNTNGRRFEIPIRCRIVFPAWEVFKQVAAWSFWGAVVAGLARGIPSVRGRTSWLSGSFARYIGWNDAADRTGPFFGQFEFAASLALLVLAFIIYRKASAGRNRRT
jgi:hypothetical protein